MIGPHPLLAAALALAPASLAAGEGTPSLLAIRAPRAETIAEGTLEHAVILVDGGLITAIGQDLPIERGIPILDVPDGWVVLPGLVDAYSRLGMDGKGYSDSRPHVKASDELWPAAEAYDDLVETGVTTLALYPAGDAIPGQAVAIRPLGETREEMILADGVYLKVVLKASSSSKRMLSGGFEGVDKYLEKEAKNREKWEKDQEKKKKAKEKAKEKEEEDEDEDKEKENGDDSEKEESEEEERYVPLEPEPEVEAFMALRERELRALISISQANEYLHLLDAIEGEEFDWDLRVPLSRDIDIFEVKERIGERACRVVMEPELTLHPGTMRQRNLPAEFVHAGAKLVLIPRRDQPDALEDWRRDVGEVVAAGLDRQVALRAMTLEPAELIGLGERIGSLEEGKDANLVIVDGDPFEPGTRVRAVMLEGRFVFDEVEQ